MTWQPLSKRVSGTQPDGPYEGVPPHLMSGVIHWFRGVCHSGPNGRLDETRVRHLIASLRYAVHIDDRGDAIVDALIKRCSQDEEFCIDVLDGTLSMWRDWNRWRALDALLSAGGSVWKVADDKISLTLVVGDEMQAVLSSAMSVDDSITAELREAWSKAYGRNANASDAWDHAIKALEDLLIPLVVPKQAKPNLGHVIGQLRNQGDAWNLVLPGKDQSYEVGPLVGMLDLAWPNHDRHGGGQVPKREPSLAEARAVVTLAITLVQWHRDSGVLRSVAEDIRA